MSKMQRTKGASGEREFCRLLGDELGMQLERKLGQARNGGNDLDAGRFAIEIKRHETLCLPAWWRQAVTSAADVTEAMHLGRPLIPAVAFRQSRKGWAVLTCWNWYLDYPDATYANAILATLPAFAAMVRETL